MSQGACQNVPNFDCQKPHVLVVHSNETYGRLVVTALQELSICAKHMRTVDEFLDLNCRVRVDVVSLEVDPNAPCSIDNLRLLRTHFGEGPGTRILAVTSLESEGLGLLLERHGADALFNLSLEPSALAAAVAMDLNNKPHW